MFGSLRELERNKRLIIVCDERSSQSNEAKEREYRATHDEYATRACGCRTATEGECGLMGLVARLGWYGHIPFIFALSPRRLLYIQGRLPPSRRGAGGKPPLQGRGTAVKRRAVPLRDSGGGVSSLSAKQKPQFWYKGIVFLLFYDIINSERRCIMECMIKGTVLIIPEGTKKIGFSDIFDRRDPIAANTWNNRRQYLLRFYRCQENIVFFLEVYKKLTKRFVIFCGF